MMALFGPQPDNREPYWSRRLNREFIGCRFTGLVALAILVAMLWVLSPLIRVFIKILDVLFGGGG